MPQPIASLSLDLDNKWSYLKTHGDRGWESYPSYLDRVVPRFLDLLEELGLRITVFVVGQDAARESNHESLAAISAAGHGIGNHSFHHEPWLHLYSAAQIEDEIVAAEEAIFSATGVVPTGFRGPGYSLSPPVLLRLPIHFSYLLFLRQFSRLAAWSYWHAAMNACRLTGVEPSLLLHPLDFLGGDEEPDLGFFPAMKMAGAAKREFVGELLA